MVQTQGGAHTKRCIATTRGMLMKGEVQGLASTLSVASWCVGRVSSRTWESARVGGAHITWCIQVVRRQGGAHTRRFVATVGVM